MQFSDQQQSFLDWANNGSGSAVLEAVAGAGKTTVLLAAGAQMPGQVAYMAYNRKIVEETKAKLTKAKVDWKKMQANTAHGFGLAAYRKTRPNVRVDGNKVRDIVDMLTSDRSPFRDLYPYSSEIVQLVSLAKQTGIGIGVVDSEHSWAEMAEHFDVFDEDNGAQPPKGKIIDLARRALQKSNEELDLIDFDDMIYLPILYRCRFWQFDVVMVDEAQDTNYARRALVRAMVKRGGRVIAVGDRHQAIYGFTGADADALDLIAQDHNCQRLPLTISYRCPQEVVKFAQQWVSHIEAAPTAPMGSVSTIDLDAFKARNDLNGSAAVLSRTTKPLVSLAFSLIRQRTPCRIEGRDVANKIEKFLTRWKIATLDKLEDRLEKYLAQQTTKLLAKKQETKLAEIEDICETIGVIIDQCQREGKTKIADAVAYVHEMFADGVENMLTLSTIHKSKGREWERVFWLDRAGTCPNKWARQDWQLGQEINLMYVAATRAKDQLIEINSGGK